MPRKTRGKTFPPTVILAREFRRQQTPAEEKLWEAIRARCLAGLKFRRQHPFDRYVLDAFCVEHQLEVEVDGGIHQELAQWEYDAARTEFLESHGLRVLRFKNEQVLNHLPQVLEEIVRATRGGNQKP